MAKKMSTGQKILLAVVGVGVVYVGYTILTKPKPIVITPTPIPSGAASGSGGSLFSSLGPLLTAAKGLFSSSGSSTPAAASGSSTTAALPASSTDTAGPDIGIMSNDPLDSSNLAGIRRRNNRIVHPM